MHWFQNILVLLMVAASVGYLCWQLKAVVAGRGKLGSCCSKGCDAQAPATPRTQFVPSELLLRKRS